MLFIPSEARDDNSHNFVKMLYGTLYRVYLKISLVRTKNVIPANAGIQRTVQMGNDGK
jgi:hypothetical protein